MNRDAELRELAVRLWTAAEAIDALRGGDRAWWWAGEQVARLSRESRLEDPNAVRRVAEVLEERLAMERKRRGGEVEA